MSFKKSPDKNQRPIGGFDPLQQSASFASHVPAFLNGSETPREYLEGCLERMEVLEPSIGAFVHLDIEAARAQADAATSRYGANKPLSPIDGCPIAVKDIIETADMPTRMNSPIFADWQSARDAACVFALHQGGAVIPGKTVTTEFATGASGPTRNPFDLSRTPGGSSSGSAAAAAAAMVPVALGTQTAGSIVRPAAYCGVYGFKPSHAALNTGGIHPLSLSHDTLGTIGANLADTWITAIHVASIVGGTPPHPGLTGPVCLPAPRRPKALVRLYTDGWSEVDRTTSAQLDCALERIAQAGVQILDRSNSPLVAELETLLQDVGRVARTITAYERRWPFAEYAKRHPGKLSETVQERAEAAMRVSRDEFLAALSQQSAIRAQVDLIRTVADGLVTLTAAGPAPIGLENTGSRSFQIFWTLTAAPCVTLPRLVVDDMPVGLQVLGFLDRDADMIAIAHWIDDLLLS